MSKSVKGGKRLKAVNIIITDYLQILGSKLLNYTTDINEIGEIVDIAGDVKRLVSGAEDIDIQGAENLKRDGINVFRALARLENNSIARFATLEMAQAHKMKNRTKKVNKTRKILARLLNGDRLSVRQMSKEYHINHPLTVICELRKQGNAILSEKVENPTGNNYNEYWIAV